MPSSLIAGKIGSLSASGSIGSLGIAFDRRKSFRIVGERAEEAKAGRVFFVYVPKIFSSLEEQEASHMPRPSRGRRRHAQDNKVYNAVGVGVGGGYGSVMTCSKKDLWKGAQEQTGCAEEGGKADVKNNKT